MLVLVTLVVGGILVGLGIMQYQAKSQVAPVTGVLGLVLLMFGFTGNPTEVLLPKEEREFRALMRTFDEVKDTRIGFQGIGVKQPPPFNKAGLPNFWIRFQPNRGVYGRSERELWDCERRLKKTVANHTICNHDVGLLFLGSREVLDHFNRAVGWCEVPCRSITGRIRATGQVRSEPITFEFPAVAQRNCWGVRALTDNMQVEVRYEGQWRAFNEATAQHVGTGDWVEVTGIRVHNNHLLPGLFTVEERRKGYLHNSNKDRAWLCFQ